MKIDKDEIMTKIKVTELDLKKLTMNELMGLHSKVKTEMRTIRLTDAEKDFIETLHPEDRISFEPNDIDISYANSNRCSCISKHALGLGFDRVPNACFSAGGVLLLNSNQTITAKNDERGI